MFKVFVNYPSYDEEYAIAEKTTVAFDPQVEPVLNAAEILQLQSVVRRVPAAPHVIRHALDLARRTRPNEDGTPADLARMIAWGAGPRAVQFMVLGAKARAVLHGQYHASTDDIRAVAHPVLRHRVITSFSAEAEGFTPDRLIDELLRQTPPDESALSRDGRVNPLLAS